MFFNFNTFTDNLRKSCQNCKMHPKIITIECLLFRSHFFIIRQNLLTILPQYHTFPRFLLRK